MVINTKGVELKEPSEWLNKEGKFTFKIEKIIEDGFTSDGFAKFKIEFKAVELGTKEPVYSHTEMFNVAQNSLWRIKQLEIALKAPECYDLNDFIGRYVIGEVKMRTFDKRDGTKGTSYQIKAWEYSAHNDKLPPIKEANLNDAPNVVVSNEIDIDDSEIPF